MAMIVDVREPRGGWMHVRAPIFSTEGPNRHQQQEQRAEQHSAEQQMWLASKGWRGCQGRAAAAVASNSRPQ